MKHGLNNIVWITKPECHGNGGWSGDNILSSKDGIVLEKALKINPFITFDIYDNWMFEGKLGAVRICNKPNSNYAIYWWNGEEKRWIPEKKS